MSAGRFRRRRVDERWDPRHPECPVPPESIYDDGLYMISAAGESATWAVYENGRWGVIYECDGHEILAAWVEPRDLPLHVLAEALRGDRR